MNKLKKYEEDRGATLTFDRIDREFIESLARYLIEIHNLTNVSVWNHLKRLKAFMKWATDRELTTNRLLREKSRKNNSMFSHQQLYGYQG